jgi:Plant transposon protein
VSAVHNMNTDYNQPIDPVLLCCMVAASIVAVMGMVEIAEEDYAKKANVDLVALGKTTLIEQRNGARKKRKYNPWNWERARLAVQEDYYGPNPHFDDRQFQRCFRITRQHADLILNEIASSDPFFRQRYDATGIPTICPKVKMLMGLKQLAYGVSNNAFNDYFQMGDSTGIECFKKLVKGIHQSTTFRDTYMRVMTRSDAKRVCQVHLDNHGVDGMIGSLDCMHIGWKNCPVAWQGQFNGAKKRPTIVLEAFADFNLWIWHASFGWAGTNNDINIWDRSPLLKSFLDGTFEKEIDFDFTINQLPFKKLWLLTDGIYPELGRFVKTIQEPGNPKAKVYAAWQEGSRKDIERAFGVLQRKFHVLTKPIEYWFIEEINHIVNATIILHNMMVAHRIDSDEIDSADFYESPGLEDEDYNGDVEDQEMVNAIRLRTEITTLVNNEAAYAAIINTDGTYEDTNHRLLMSSANFLSLRLETVERRWGVLHDVENHRTLRNAIIEQVNQRRI